MAQHTLNLMDSVLPLRIGIVGLGLIGGSLALALKGRCAARIGMDHDSQTVARALADGAIDRGVSSLHEMLACTDLVVLCQPVQALIGSLANIAAAPHLPIVCDAASVKAPVVQAAIEALGARAGRFVGAHPIAGKAEHGFAAAEAGLFVGRTVVLCGEASDSDARRLVRALWLAVGGQVHELSPARHDEVYAVISHLPQMVTWAYLRTVAGRPWHEQLQEFAGPGYAGFTRLGRSNPSLWADIALQNRGPLLDGLARLTESLDELRRTLARGRAEELEAFFDHARATLGQTPG